jgi:ABC-type Fe3+-hydroxamate transport system substrate-binding protein
MPTLRVRDDLNRELTFARPPERIVSLVPSDTHSLFALGAGARVIGRTRYCVEPAGAVDAIATVGGTKDVDVEAVLDLAPDLVIGNQEENTRAALEALALRTRVLVSMPRRVPDGLAHLARLARVLGVEREPAVVDLVRRGHALGSAPPPPARLTAFVPIWMEPLMTMNADTFGSDVLARAGVGNAFGDRLRLYPLAADLGKQAAADAAGRDTRYPRVTTDELVARRPDVIILPDEPHAFTADDRATLAALPTPAAGRLVEVSGKDLFWYGAWTVDALPRLAARLAALALAAALGACGGDDGAAPPDGAGGLPTTCAGACATLDLTATFSGTSRGFDRAFYGLTRGRAGTTLYVEATGGGDPGCPTETSRTPERTFGVADLALPASTAPLAGAGALLDFTGDLLPGAPVASASATTVTPVAARLCASCVGMPAPSDPDGLVALDVTATFAAPPGTVSGRVYATHCDSLDTLE